MNHFKHYCPDWDGLCITLYDMEALGCSCYRGEPAADAMYAERSKEWDEINERLEAAALAVKESK